MKFTFNELYPEVAGITTRERGIPDLADRVALGARVTPNQVAKANGRRWVSVLVLVGLLILFRYV